MSASDAQPVSLLISDLAGAVIAVEACHVLYVLEGQATMSLQQIDLAAVLALPTPPEKRRGVRLRGAPYVLLAGKDFSVHQTTYAAVQPCPPLLGGLHARCGVMGLVSLNHQFAFLLDVKRLIQGVP